MSRGGVDPPIAKLERLILRLVVKQWPPTDILAMASNLLASCYYSSNGLQPTSDGSNLIASCYYSSHGLQPTSDGLHLVAS